MNSFRELVDAFGGVSAFAEAMGQSRLWAKKVRERDSLNARWFSATVSAARDKGLSVDERLLCEIAAREAA